MQEFFNHSLQPIYNAVILWKMGQHSLRTDAVNVIGPGSEKLSDLPRSFLNYFDSAYATTTHMSHREAYENSQSVANQIGLIFSFRDSQGIRWERDQYGLLQEIPLSTENENLNHTEDVAPEETKAEISDTSTENELT